MTQMLDGGPFRMFRLTNEFGGLGLSCTPVVTMGPFWLSGAVRCCHLVS